MSKAARSTFQGSPNDELVAVDVYEEVDPGVRNAFQSQYTAFTETLTTQLGQTRSNISSLASGIRDREIGLNTARKQLQDTLGGSIRDLNNLPDTLRNRFIDASSINSPEHQWMETQIDGIRHVIKNGDYTTVKGITGVLGGLTGNPAFEVLGLGPVMGLIQVGLEELAHWEIPELVDDLLHYLDDSPSSVKYQVVRDASMRLGGIVDLGTLEVILQHVPGSVIFGANPYFVSQFLQRYKFPEGTDPTHYGDLRNRLVVALNQVQSDWFWTDRNGEDVFNIQTLTRISDDARILLCTDQQYMAGVVASPEYSNHNYRQLINQMYPLVVLN